MTTLFLLPIIRISLGIKSPVKPPPKAIFPFSNEVVEAWKLMSGMVRMESRKSFMGILSQEFLTFRYTAVEPITFKSVCEAIASHAFDVSDLPVLLSLEVHCDIPQQQRMVKVVVSLYQLK